MIARCVIPGTGADGVWARASDFNSKREIHAGVSVWVAEGNEWGDRTFHITTDDPIGVSDPITFSAEPAAGTPATAQSFDCPLGVLLGDPVYVDGNDSVAVARADAGYAKQATHLVTELITATRCRAAPMARITGLGGLVPGARYFLGDTGGITNTIPVAGTGFLCQRLGSASGLTVLEAHVDPFAFIV